MTRFSTLIATALLGSVALAPVPATAQSAKDSYVLPTQRLSGLADFVDGVMAQQIATREVAGAVVVVVHRGRVLFARGYGFADIERGVTVDPLRTLFRPGSVSKMFTWSAVMQQVELGRISLDADVNQYLDFKIPPFEGKPIRMRDLLSHTPGFDDIWRITAPSVDKITPYGQWIREHMPQRLWAPGTEIAYSNYGTALAGYIVERVSGEPFADYADSHVFRPLGMGSTFREPLPAAMEPHRAIGYRFRDGQFTPRPFELLSPVMPAGSSSVSGADMARFMMAMLDGGRLGGNRILKPESVRFLMADSFANAPGLPGMAHGFFVHRPFGPRLVGHGGNTADSHASMVLAPELGLGFFICETGGQGSTGGRTELQEALIGRLFPQAPAPRVAAPADEKLPFGSYRPNRRDHKMPVNPERDVKVVPAGANGLRVTNGGKTTYWERIGPMRFEQVTGARAGGPYEQLLFYGEQGRWRFSFFSSPHMNYQLVEP